MQYIEPRQAKITIDNNVYNGTLSGNTTFVKFECKDEGFLELLPSGEFDTMYVNRETLSRHHQDIIYVAEELVRLALK